MEYQSLLNAGLVLISSVTGWFARELWTAGKELKIDLAKLREDLPKEYISKVD